MDHVAIMNPKLGLIEKILSGEKKVESRWSKFKIAPWDRVKPGDKIYFKNSSEPVSAVANVNRVLQIEDLDEGKFGYIVTNYGDQISLVEREYSEWYKGKNYCVLIWLEILSDLFVNLASGWVGAVMAVWMFGPKSKRTRFFLTMNLGLAMLSLISAYLFRLPVHG